MAPADAMRDDERENGTRFAECLHHRTDSTPPGTAYGPAIWPTSTFALDPQPSGPYQYARWANPTWTALEDSLAILEGGPVVAFPSGMAAIASIFHGLLKPGHRILLPADGYFTTRVVADKYLAPQGIDVQTCSTLDFASRSFDGLRLVLVETPSNPGLDLVDLRELAERAHAAGALLVVDNTMMTAQGQRPLDFGADLVVASDTKALNGHSDALMGHVASCDSALTDAVRDWRRAVGAIPGPFEAWLVHRGLETLELRLARMNESALYLATHMSRHPAVRALRYPGLPSHPQHALAVAQMNGFGGLIGVEFAGEAEAERFIAGCRYLRQTTSFGGVHSSAERRARWGDQVPAGFVRLSVGCEPTAALWADFQRSLDALVKM